MENTTAQPELIINGHHGIYIPQLFALGFLKYLEKPLTVEQLDDLRLPDREFYWETWEEILNNAVIVWKGQRYHLEQDQDVWIVPEGSCLEG
jgi:hypothetical protein